MQLSPEDMKRLMTGGASLYNNLPGQPSAVDYWIQAYLGATAWLDKPDNSIAINAKASKRNRPAPLPLQEAFQKWSHDEQTWDYRELLLLCKAYKLDLPAHHIAELVYHPRQRQLLSDGLLMHAHDQLISLSAHFAEASVFSSALNVQAFLKLSPLDRRLCCRFRWLMSTDDDWVEWLTHCSAKEQFDILLDNIYRPYGPAQRILHQWGKTKSKKLRALLQIIAWKYDEVIDMADLPKWCTPLSQMTTNTTSLADLDWPTPPLLNIPLSKEERMQTWFAPMQEGMKASQALPEISLHAAFLYGSHAQLREIWLDLSFDENAEPLYRAAAKMLEPTFFLSNYAEVAAECNFPPDQFDLVQKWIYASDVFIPAEQSPEIWSLMETWSEMPEAKEANSELRRMATALCNRLHPSAVSERDADPFDFFGAPWLTEWENQMKKRRSLYQTLAKWQKNN